MGVPLEYLVAASFMAPGGLLFAKIIKHKRITPDDNIADEWTVDDKSS